MSWGSAGLGLSDTVKCEYGCRLSIMKNSKKEDEKIHNITAMVSFIISTVMLLPSPSHCADR